MPDDSATALRQALEDASRLRRENAALQQTARTATTQMFGEAGARIAAQDSAIDGQIVATEQLQAAAQAEHARLLAEGDFAGASAATARMVDASTRISSLRGQKEQVVLQRANLERTQAQEPAGGNSQQGDPLEGMNDRERDWVSQHPAYLSDPIYRRKAAAAAGYAVNVLGHSRESQEYFEYVNDAVGGNAAPAITIRTDDNFDQGGGDASDVRVPRMPQPEVPRPVAQNREDDPAMTIETNMVDEMYPQTRAIGKGGQGIRNIAAPPSRVIRELNRQHARGGVIEPTLEELDTARRIIADIAPDIAAQGDEEIIRTYHAWYNAPSSKRKLRRWYGRDAA